MNTKTLSNHALLVIDQYLHFKVGSAVCSIPYFNNKTIRARAALRANIGKGSPKEIYEEIMAFILKNHVSADTLADESLKRLLTDQNIGIDCSGFAYYILNAESEENKKGSLERHIHFVNAKGLLGKFRAKFRPIENCDVATFANNKNSSVIQMNEVVPGDIITMMATTSSTESIQTSSINTTLVSSVPIKARSIIDTDRDHILVIHQVEYQNFIPIKIHYSHAMAYPEDGVYGTGIKQGIIEIIKPEGNLIDQLWIENEKQGSENRIFIRAQKSKTEIRRIKS